ncbi:catalytic activity protein [[Candida] boidinii]|nr:catalytic activity protein [[Candida] boidinii]GME70594.1 unnamed protein product [[Candida] boidinii]
MTNDKLFDPLEIGEKVLKHRIIMAPLTRYRAPNMIPGRLMSDYYTQRASSGGLLITEATYISPICGVQPNNPRIDTGESIEGWKSVVNDVHKKEGIFYMQLNHFGRTGIPQLNQNKQPLSSSPIKLSAKPFIIGDKLVEHVVPKEMTRDDMDAVICDFCQAAYNAIHLAGFDGIELHGANGYLIDQFLEDNINLRTDEYGGCIENRSKFPLEILDAVIKKVGNSKKVAFRISPWDNFNDADDSDPVNNFSYVVKELEKRHLAYIHVIEARSDSNGGKENDDSKSAVLNNDMLYCSVAQFVKLAPTTPIISAGGWNSENYQGILKKTGISGLVFGRYFISNPDLPKRLKSNFPLTKYDRTTFYSELDPHGYIDYPVYSL